MIKQLAQDGICASCLADLRKCDACGRPVREGVEMQDGTGRIFCQTCAGTLPGCFVCGTPVDGRGCVVGEGRFRCCTCSTNAVDDPLQAHRLYLEVQETMAESLGMELGVPTALVPMDTEQFQAMLQTQMIADAHSSERRMPRGLYVRKGRKRGIYLELGLPRVATIEVIAHELGHAWQVERSPLLTDPVLVEGQDVLFVADDPDRGLARHGPEIEVADEVESGRLDVPEVVIAPDPGGSGAPAGTLLGARAGDDREKQREQAGQPAEGGAGRGTGHGARTVAQPFRTPGSRLTPRRAPL